MRGEEARATSSAPLWPAKSIVWPAKPIVWLAKPIVWTLWLPIGVVRGFRRSLTAASTTLLFFSVLTLNIVWGYPWIGMFAACVSLLLVGWVTNRVFSPRLRVGLKLPTSACAGESWAIRQHLENVGRLPAMELRGRFDLGHGKRTDWSGDAEFALRRIPARGWATVSGTLCVERRGVWQVPDVIVESLFPFYLFRATRRIPSEATIAITPRLLHASEEPAIRMALTVVSGWATQQAAGLSAEYVGSREYQEGMSVRRWDFASWARLGRPIVREYTTPSLQTISIVVDTAIESDEGFRRRVERTRLLERLLSVAATVLVERGRGDVGFRLFVTDQAEAPGEPSRAPSGIVATPSDIEPLLIRLASADSVSAEVADRQIASFLTRTSRSEAMVLSTRENPGFLNAGVGRVNLIRVGGGTYGGEILTGGEMEPASVSGADESGQRAETSPQGRHR